jgi:hypothetical protein
MAAPAVPTTGDEGAPPPAAQSTLAEQNDLFAAALAARRRGDLAEAMRWLDQLIRLHPRGQLADQARAERGRLGAAAADRGEAD